MHLKHVFGTMTIPAQTSKEDAVKMLRLLIEDAQNNGSIAEIDTARMYADGKTEIVLGEILSEHPDIASKLVIASKVNPFSAHDKSLSGPSVKSQFEKITSALKLKCVDILYLHAPDPQVTILETLEAIQNIYESGGFKELGLSNYQSWEVVHIYHLCKERGWVVPTIYQGMYNCITREVERELFPALRTLNMRFYAYNPLAGGLLSGKHTQESVKSLEEGRFKLSNKMYRDRYLSEPQFRAIERIQKSISEYNDKHNISLSMVEVSMRWLSLHSSLNPAKGDGIIFGASKLDYFVVNSQALRNTDPLPLKIVESINEAWDIIRSSGSCPSYERGFSQMGNH